MIFFTISFYHRDQIIQILVKLKSLGVVIGLEMSLDAHFLPKIRETYFFYWTLWDLKGIGHISENPTNISAIAFVYRVKRVVAEEGLEPPTRGL